MKLLFDFFPILIFFIVFKFYGIYIATAAFLVATCIQIIWTWFRYRRIEKMHLITFGLGLVLGAATLLLHDELFIKWKPTAIYWVFAVIFFSSQFIGETNLLQRMMQNNITLPENIWKRLNISWAIFFAIMGILNLYVVYNYDTNTWVNFKLFGMMGLTLAFVIIQGIYMSRHIKSEDQPEKQ